MRLMEVVAADIRAPWRRKPGALLLLFALPLLYGVLFGLAYSSNVVKYVPTVVYDEDHTATSRALIQAYSDSERYEIVAEVTSQEAMEQKLRDNEVLVAIAIPPDFSRDIKLGLASQVLVSTNSTNNMFANAVITSSQEIIQTFSVATGQKLLEASNQMPAQALRTAAPIKIGTRIIHNPTTSYTNFMLPGLVANGLQIAILLVAGTVLAAEYRRLAVWQGTSSTVLVTGKMLACWLYAATAFVLALAVIAALFAVPLKSDIFPLIVLGGAFTFLLVNLCLFVSAACGDEIYALQIPLLYIMPGLLFSGLSWPHFAMNDAARIFSALMPLTYMADTLRDLLLSGHSPDLGKNIAIMLTSGGVFFGLSILAFSCRRKRLLRRAAKEGIA